MKLTKYLFLSVTFLSLCVSSFAQRGSQVRGFVKAVTHPIPAYRLLAPVEQAEARAFMSEPASYGVSAYTTQFVSKQQNLPEGVSLSDGRGKPRGKHSIVPSASTILGSDAFTTPQEKKINFLRQQSEAAIHTAYLTKDERRYYRLKLEKLGSLYRSVSPTPPEKLHEFLSHDVPPETLQASIDNYMRLVQDIHQANVEVSAKLLYSSLPNEAWHLSMLESREINKLIDKIRSRINILQTSFAFDPYLMTQKEYWDRIFFAFNPLLSGVGMNIPRPDNRKYLREEFILYNPDGSAPYLPNSSSLIQGEKEEDDDYDDYEDGYDSYGRAMPAEVRAAKRAAELAHFQQMMAFVQEKDELLPYIPENLRIAFINDDANPRLNFESWAKKGFLGKGATIETFKEGESFMKLVRLGIHYDLVLTDLLVPYAGMEMIEEFRELDPHAAVIALSKFVPGDGDELTTKKQKKVQTLFDYFSTGIDGYMWYNSNLDAGAYGYIEYLRSMKNYYYYKKLHKWAR